ncbi:MAG: preprotein translocase subunit SecG [Pyrinomonadaceae bacterium]
MVYFLYALFFISCIVLVTTILLQPGKADAGALFTSNISSTAFGPRGTQSVLSKITIGAAVLFMLSALLLSMPALTGNISVLQTTSTNSETPAATPSPAQADTITNLNANVQPASTAANASETTVSNSSANASPANK